MSWTFDSTVVTMDSTEYTMDGSEPITNFFTTKVFLAQRLVVSSGTRVVVAKDDNE